MEVKFGNLFHTTVHMHRHRVGARGTATTFPMPWQALLAELQKLDAEGAQGEAPDVPKVGRDLAHVVQVLLKTNESDDRDALSKFVHQARVRRHVVVDRILEARARGHRAYVLVDPARVRQKALELPEDGVPPELLQLLPDDQSLDKLQVQKAATPVEGRRDAKDPEEAARAIAVQRPNAVVCEKSCNDEGDINERRWEALRHVAEQLEGPTTERLEPRRAGGGRRAEPGPSAAAGSEGAAGDRAEEAEGKRRRLNRVAQTRAPAASVVSRSQWCFAGVLVLASVFLAGWERPMLASISVTLGRNLHLAADGRSLRGLRQKLKDWYAESDVQSHRLVLSTGKTVANQY